MRVRPATTADVPIVAKIGSKAFAKDPIYAHIFPWRTQYPYDVYCFFEADIKSSLLSSGELIMVAETDSADQLSGPGENPPKEMTSRVVAYAQFKRWGSAEERATWNASSLTKRVQLIFLWLRTRWNSIFSPNRAISLPTMRDYHRQASAIYAKQLQNTTSWIEFETLAVDPAYQGHGYGEKLVEYCGMRAWEEDVLVLGEASSACLPMYLHFGCEEVGQVLLPKKVVQPKNYPDSEFILDSVEIAVLKWKA